MDGRELEAFGEYMRGGRAAGLSFEASWEAAHTEVFSLRAHDPRWAAGVLVEALRATKPAWRRAWDGRPARRGEAAAARLVAALGEREQVDDEERRQLVA